MAECTVVEVYEIAASIGKDLEKLIQTFGGEAVAELMPKIILSLEKLEAATKKSEKHDAVVEDLTIKLETVEKQLLLSQEELLRSSKEWHENEETWRDEAKDLLQMISSLQKNNEDLKRKVTDQAGVVSHEMARAEEDHKVMYKLKEAVDRQRDEIRAKDKELRQKALDIEALQLQIERLARLNMNLRRKQALVQHQATNLIDEKVELEARMQALQQDIEQQDIEDSVMQQQGTETGPVQFDPPINMEGKMIIDLKDPNRPRFTKEELKLVLRERIELKTQVFEMEEQLSRYKSDEHKEEDTVDNSSVKDNKSEAEKAVNQESGIRKLFKIFSRRDDKKENKSKEKGKEKHKQKENENGSADSLKTKSGPQSSVVESSSEVSVETKSELQSSDVESSSEREGSSPENVGDQEGKVEFVAADTNEVSGGHTVWYDDKSGQRNGGPCSHDDMLQPIEEMEEECDSSSLTSSTSSDDWRKSRLHESYKSRII